MTKNNPDVAIIIPVYNEAPVIKKTVRSISKYFDNIVCVVDGSTDGSADEIAKTKAMLISHPFNMGQGAALQTGAEFARELKGVKYFVHFDADGQHQVKDVLKMIAEIRKGKFDILLGSRFLGKAVNMPASKRRLLKMAVAFSNLTSGLKLTDTHNGLRVFNQAVAQTMQITQPDMAHGSEILELIAKNKYRYKEMPVTIVYSDYSTTKNQTHINGQAHINAINIGFDSLLRRLFG